MQDFLAVEWDAMIRRLERSKARKAKHARQRKLIADLVLLTPKG